ncbi:MAG: CDP-2,3-bis-(O-geranylgeranyl)-sn-glycerol synthase [Candidatus Micrarchaeia archaeon]|jgi:CDP-2,3-bis-(O-geranylgeranyl)-sn-glycerol synthase
MDGYLLRLLGYIFPAYVANAAPVLFGGGTKIDLNKNFVDGKRLLGDGKTVNGFASGLFLGTAAGAALAVLFPADFMPLAGGLQAKTIASFFMALGALSGDLFGSFLKRRMGMERGQPSFLLDQLTFLFFALAFSSPFHPLPGAEELVVLVVATFLLHVFFNALAHRLKLKNVPW